MVESVNDDTLASKNLRNKYRWTSRVYDLADAYWERQYRRWRPKLVSDLAGRVVEAGVGTGRNLPFYSGPARGVAFDLSEGMLQRARKRAPETQGRFSLVQADAAALPFPRASFDWYVSTFLYCVLPDSLQRAALQEMERVLKPGGRFRLLEIVFSKQVKNRWRQKVWAPLVERVYGARFDRRTLEWVRGSSGLEITETSFLKTDTHLLIQGVKRS